MLNKHYGLLIQIIVLSEEISSFSRVNGSLLASFLTFVLKLTLFFCAFSVSIAYRQLILRPTIHFAFSLFFPETLWKTR